ncbi:MAG: hypothetical protein RLW68_01010 [Devosia marina]|uniref:hypothetical protein n=1 Tax=Devosia marina TaxID=2683198 RepID=UPI0032ECDD3B
MNERPNIPISEQFRLVAKEWVTLDGAARMLEESKTAVQSQMMKALGDKPAAHAERDVKASPEWHDYIQKMVDARSQANLKKVQLEFLRMKFSEFQSDNANRRAEMRL